MTGAASIAAVALAAVFGWAAVAKVSDRRAAATAFGGLGLPAAAFLATAVPATEAAIAVVLVLRPDVGGALALAMLAAFTLVIARALSTHSGAGCGCFGSHRVEPVSPADIVRNGLLAAMAVIATGTAHLAWPGLVAGAAMVVLLAVAVAIQTVAHHRQSQP